MVLLYSLLLAFECGLDRATCFQWTNCGRTQRFPCWDEVGNSDFHLTPSCPPAVARRLRWSMRPRRKLLCGKAHIATSWGLLLANSLQATKSCQPSRGRAWKQISPSLVSQALDDCSSDGHRIAASEDFEATTPVTPCLESWLTDTVIEYMSSLATRIGDNIAHSSR